MLELPGGYFTRRAPGREEWACHNRQACGRRTAQIGQWIGVRVLRRTDLDGTQWTIRRQPKRTLTAGPEGFALICVYRDHRTLSWHTTAEAAKAHRDDVTRSWEAQSLREYGASR
jgi:hypothetical protein